MEYIEHIKKAVEYIEDNLCCDIKITETARAAGYSVYHFLRIFKETTGLTPADYVRKRRLSEIINRIEQTGRPMSEIAFEYGFNSKENFIRAFKNEHYILPGEYNGVKNSLKLYARLDFYERPFVVEPEFLTLPEFSLTLYKNDGESPAHFWNIYNTKKLSSNLSGGIVCEDYGVSVWNEEKDRFDYHIGIKTSEAINETDGTIRLSVPANRYAVFTTPPVPQCDFVNTIHKTWNYINKSWLPDSCFKYAPGCSFECYVENSRTFSEKIYIPITNK